jgi:hypothetical protein
MRWGSVRVVTTGWRRVVTTRLAQAMSAHGLPLQQYGLAQQKTD